MVKFWLNLTTWVRIICKHTPDSTYGSKQNIINYRPPRGFERTLQVTLHMDTIIVCHSNARVQIHRLIFRYTGIDMQRYTEWYTQIQGMVCTDTRNGMHRYKE